MISASAPIDTTRTHLAERLLLCLLALLFFQNIGIFTLPNSDTSIKLYHLVLLPLLAFVPVSPKDGRILPLLPTLFFLIALAVAILNIVRYGFNARVSTLFYAFAVFFFCFQMARVTDNTRILKGIQSIILLLFAAIALKNMIFWETLSKGYGSALLEVYYFFPGGQNIEAGWMGLFLLFFVRQNPLFFLLLFAYVLATTLLYESRTGQLITILSIGFYIMVRLPATARYLLGGMVLLMVVYTALHFDYDRAIAWVQAHGVGRFEEVGSKQDGFAKRVMIWTEAMPLILAEWKFGYGTGNIIAILKQNTTLNLFENNLHNIYLQLLADGGATALLPFLLILAQCIYRFLGKRAHSPELLVFAIGYAVAGMVQFTGMEVLFWAALGLSYGYEHSKE